MKSTLFLIYARLWAFNSDRCDKTQNKTKIVKDVDFFLI